VSSKRRTRLWKEALKVQSDRVFALGVLKGLTNAIPPPSVSVLTKVELPEDEERQATEREPNTLVEPVRFEREWDR